MISCQIGQILRERNLPFSQSAFRLNVNQPGSEALYQICLQTWTSSRPTCSGHKRLPGAAALSVGQFYGDFTLEMSEPVFLDSNTSTRVVLPCRSIRICRFILGVHQRRLATQNMPSTDIYARCNFTRSGHPNIRFNVVIKLPKAKLEELCQLPANRDQTDNQLLGSLAGKVITIVYPEPGATFAVGCERYPEGAIPTEIKERPEGTKIDELTFWSI